MLRVAHTQDSRLLKSPGNKICSKSAIAAARSKEEPVLNEVSQKSRRGEQNCSVPIREHLERASQDHTRVVDSLKSRHQNNALANIFSSCTNMVSQIQMFGDRPELPRFSAEIASQDALSSGISSGFSGSSWN
jgi:hypothetical protein